MKISSLALAQTDPNDPTNSKPVPIVESTGDAL